MWLCTYKNVYGILVKMIGLYISLFLLGLAAVDPIGIAAMPVFLSQSKPYVRSFIFLAGSFMALLIMGLLFSRGLGAATLHVEQALPWIVPTIEAVAGVVLLGAALHLSVRTIRGYDISKPSSQMMKRLQLGNGKLFLLGALIVSLQSIVDVVFVVAMIKIESLHLSFIELGAGIFIYASAALLFQILVVGVYRLTPLYRRNAIISVIRRLISRYASRTAIVVSFVLGGGLMLNSILNTMGCAHF